MPWECRVSTNQYHLHVEPRVPSSVTVYSLSLNPLGYQFLLLVPSDWPCLLWESRVSMRLSKIVYYISITCLSITLQAPHTETTILRWSCLDIIPMKCQSFSYIQCFICFAADLYILLWPINTPDACMISLLAWFLFSRHSRTQCIPANWYWQCYQVSLFRRLLT